MTLREAADMLGLSPTTLRVQIRNGKLKATKRGRDWHVTKAAVERYRRDSLRAEILDAAWPVIIGQSKDRATAYRWALEARMAGQDARMIAQDGWYFVRARGGN